MPPEAGNDAWSRYSTREEQRALFAERAGGLPIATAGLLCKLDNGLILETPVPLVTLNVLPIPELDRPEDFAGVVGPLVLQTHVDPDRLESGGTIHITVSIRGMGNLWDVGDLLGRWTPIEADVFARKPQLELRPGSRLSVQKIFRYDVVPRGTGPFAIPPVRLSYFDPIEARYLVARSPSVEVTVSPRQTSADWAPEPKSSRRVANGPIENSPSRLIPMLALSFAVAAGIALRRWRRAPRHNSRAPPIATGDSDRDASELVRALRAALASHYDHKTSEHSGATLGSRYGPGAGDALGSDYQSDIQSDQASEAAELLETLERSRFDPGTDAPNPDLIERALARLDGATRRRS